jgi:tRNA modification GTPase
MKIAEPSKNPKTASDTIVALSSGSPPSGVAVLRVSGPRVASILREMLGRLPEPRRLTLAIIAFGGKTLDRGLVAWFPAPHSFTGEDCGELHLHGSPAVVRSVLRALTGRAGIRLAQAGEFTRRAFENGKLDLTEVEGLGDLIAAETETQRVQALARMSGGLSERIASWRGALLDLRAEVEARLDFSDEGDVSDLPAGFASAVAALRGDLSGALAGAEGGRIVREGLRVALAGPPNAGKSSLLNALARSDVAIVTDEPGTTRDVREVPMDLGGRLVILLDMAGLRSTGSKAEAEGVRRAQAESAAADLVLWLVAPDVADIAWSGLGREIWRIGTKADLGGLRSNTDLDVSAQTGTGIAVLLQRLGAFAQSRAGSADAALISRERDIAALEQAIGALDEALIHRDELELCAEALRRASHGLERLVGRMDAEAVLDRLFLSFCIGK